MVSWRNGNGGSCLLGEADNEALGILFCGLFVSLIGWSSVSGFLDKLIVFRGFGLSGKIKPFYLFWRIFRSAFVIYLGSSRFWVWFIDGVLFFLGLAKWEVYKSVISDKFLFIFPTFSLLPNRTLGFW